MGKFGVGSIPHAFIVNRKGEVVYHDHPMNPEFETQLAKVAQEKPVPEVNVPDVKGMSDEQLAELSVGELKAVLRYCFLHGALLLAYSHLCQQKTWCGLL